MLKLTSLILAVAILTLVQEARAQASRVLRINTSDDEALEVRISDYRNDRNQRELKFETTDVAKHVLGYARDLSGDGEVDTFFLVADDGISTYRDARAGTNSLARARRTLQRHAEYSGKYYMKIITRSVLRAVLVSFQYVHDARQVYLRDWIDLEELRIRFEETGHLMTSEQQILMLQLLDEGHRVSLERFEDAVKIYSIPRVALDAVLIVSGVSLLKWAGKSVLALRAGFNGQIRRHAGRAAVGAGVRLNLRSYQAKIVTGIRALSVRGALKGAKAQALRLLRSREFAYMLIAPPVQAAVETAVYYNEVKSPNPVDTVRNVLNHERIQENIGISVADSILIAGAHAFIKRTGARIALLGVIGAGTSLAVGTAVSGSQSKGRIALDALWSIVIDTLEGEVVFRALANFDQMAARSKNPRIKVAGWAMVMVIGAGTSLAYNRASNLVDSQQTELMLVPIEVLE